MGIGTSIGNFGSLTTTTGSVGVFFDVGALSRKAGSLSRDPAALGGNANGLIGNPDALSSNPEALSFDTGALSFNQDGLSFNPDALSFEPDELSFEPDALSFDAFHQRLDSNGLISSNLQGIASKPLKFAFSQTLNIQLTTHN